MNAAGEVGTTIFQKAAEMILADAKAA